MAVKKHIVKINEEQYSYIKGDDDTRPFDGNSQISVSGKLNRETDGNPKTDDDVAKAFTPQAWTYYRTNRTGRISESDTDGDAVDDFYNVDSANTLSNGNPSDNNTVVSQTIITKLDGLIKAMNGENLSDMQKANIVNRILESIDFSTMPYKLKKELRLKIN